MKNTYQYIWRFALILVLVISSIEIKAQDLRYSQFFNTPSLLNPALTGIMPSDYRVGIIHRKQWVSLQNPYTSFSGYADYNIRKPGKQLNKIGLGLTFSNDNVGNGIFVNNQVLLATSFQFKLNKRATKHIVFGLQGGAVTKSLDQAKLIYASQFNPDQFALDPSKASGEQTSNNAFVPLLHFGTMFTNKVSSKFNYVIGISAYNLIPNSEDYIDNVIGDGVKNSSLRSQANLGADIGVSNKLTLSPQILIAMQAGSNEVNAGGIAKIKSPFQMNSKPVDLEAGLFYRLGDAGVVYGGAMYNNIRLGLSYDFSYSQVRNVKPSGNNLYSGSYEITLTYFGFLQRLIPGPVTIPCSTF
ncbi:MAG: PorP/SprF family type IX secretion system membrane protein [Flexibacteraceae bacterium]